MFAIRSVIDKIIGHAELFQGLFRIVLPIHRPSGTRKHNRFDTHERLSTNSIDKV